MTVQEASGNCSVVLKNQLERTRVRLPQCAISQTLSTLRMSSRICDRRLSSYGLDAKTNVLI